MRRLRRAAVDDEITAVVLKIRNPTIGRAKLAELRASIDRLQASGKKVYADVETVRVHLEEVSGRTHAPVGIAELGETVGEPDPDGFRT